MKVPERYRLSTIPGNTRIIDGEVIPAEPLPGTFFCTSIPRPILTSTPPTVPGLYWYRLDVPKSTALYHCRVWLRKSVLEAEGVDGHLEDVRTFGRLWAGPLPEPLNIAPSGVLISDKALNPRQVKEIREQFEARHVARTRRK